MTCFASHSMGSIAKMMFVTAVGWEFVYSGPISVRMEKEHITSTLATGRLFAMPEYTIHIGVG